MFVHNALASTTSLERSWLAVVHPAVPVRQHVPRELGVEMHHADAEVGSEEVQVVRNGPHHDEVDVLVAELPRDCARCASDRVLLVNGDDDLSVRREDLPLVISVLKVSIKRVRDGEAEHPPRPVFDGDDAADFMAFVFSRDVPQGRAVEVRKAVLDENVTVADEPVDQAGVVGVRYCKVEEQREDARSKPERRGDLDRGRGRVPAVTRVFVFN